MKVTLNWLKQYVDFDWSPEQLAERLTMLGLEVEGVHKIAGEFEGVVVAQILTRDKVPAADKLSVCKVNDGKGERTIICGAQNHKPGDKVPLILPNFALPLKPGDKEPFVIKERKVFGIVSQGMMCSPQELGLPDPVDGLLILPENAKVGQPFAEYLGRTGGDVVYDLEVTPNRPDLNNVIGIAREIAAVTGNKLRLPDVNLVGTRSTASQTSSRKDGDAVERVPTVSDLVAVRIEDAELCPRYTARVIRGVKIGPSPDWLRSTLAKIGIRSISNVVDVTNYVMMECGQPLHAFDYHLIAKASGAGVAPAAVPPTVPVGEAKAAGVATATETVAGRGRRDARPTIVIRRATEGENFKTLDDVERTLASEMLLIADEQKGIALAGVMGGQNSEINDQTVDVLIESAYFNPVNIRRTSKVLGLRSDASYRFERGADIGINDWASRRCAQLILETAGGQLAEGVVDAYPNPASPKEVTLRHRKVDELLGVAISPADQICFLESLGLERMKETSPARVLFVEASTDTISLLNKKMIAGEQGSVTFVIPTWRVDLKREADLIEEIERLYGVDKIPATPPRGALGSNAFDAMHDEIAEVRRILCGLGLNEAQGQTLVGNEECRIKNEELVALANPLSADMDVLRPSLLPGLLTILRHNVSRKNYDVAVFEVGRVFRRAEFIPRVPKPASDTRNEFRAPVEDRRVAIALTGQRAPGFWSGD
ncbi:MAG: phenylalanine--tRNA ligase subunit beta, partial [Verrucomicrobia bacterium]|nr:phenylalanine--tRNA ligase subunit beta [Verrucomicrobiota bacterium]